MSTVVHRTPKSGRQSLFFQDLASPISSRRGKFSSPGQAAAVSALWRENFGGSDLPPPPMYTLEDRSDFSPESGVLDYPMSPEIKSDPRTPIQSSGRDFSTPAKSKSGASTSFAVLNGQQNQQSSTSSSWWSPKASGTEQDNKGKSSPVEGVVQPGALITLPPPREVAKPEIQRNSIAAGNLDEEEWVTVYGFSPADTNIVLREFEKCGVILKHVPGPRDANWMHILYQKRSDAQRALSKNGTQINGVLIIGVKPVDPVQREALNERLNNQGFMTLTSASSKTSEPNNLRQSRPYYNQNGNTSARQSGGGMAIPTKSLRNKVMEYLLKHLSKVEVITNDPSGCTFTLGFDNLRSQSVAPPQWTMRNIDDRNRILLCILNICKEVLGRLPKVVGIDVVEMALWAKENTPSVTTQKNQQGGPDTTTVTESDLRVTVEKELVSQAEEEDMEALLGIYVMGVGEAEAFSEQLKQELLALEAANVHAILETEPLVEEVLQGLEAATNCVDDMDEWLRIFNVKLRHMREDIESIETHNNKLEMQSVNNKALIEELDKLLERLHVPSEYAACLTGGLFDEARMLQNVEACEWLAGALHGLEVPNLDSAYANMQAVKEKQADLEKLKATFVQRASEFLRNYFASLVDFMITDKSYFSQRGQLKRPDHADLRYKCRTYARLLQHLKSLDKSCLGPLRKAYCSSLNLLLRREAREFANELRASTKASRNPTMWLEASTGGSQSGNSADTSAVSDAYAKMLTIFIPLLVDESSFFAHFMCFEVPALVPPGGVANGNKSGSYDDDLGIMDIDDSDSKTDLQSLNDSLQDLLDGIQEDFYAVVDWAYKIDPLRCISMHGITERYLSGQKADAAGFVRLLLGDLESKISMKFSQFVDDACHQIERNERNVRQMGVLSYIPRFATLATRMEQYIQGQSRDLVDQAYTKFVSIMFVTLEKLAQTDPKYADIFLLENYAAFQNSLYDLANVVPTLAKFYHQASEAYEQACTRHISMILYSQFERLFQFARKIEDLMFTISPEEIPFQLGLSKMDLGKTLRSSLSGVDKSIAAMHKKLQKNLTSKELLPSLWDKCKKEFLDKYDSFCQLVAKIYPTETIPSATEMRDLVASM